jgi:DNA polymerase I-like protein with 3'-5' exonuclease and polymerase domains
MKKVPVVRKGLPVCKEGFVGFDTEYTPTEVLCGAIADTERAITLGAKDLRKVAKCLTENIVVAHNMTSEIDSMMRMRIPALKEALEYWLQGNRIRDTLLVSKLADENRGIGGYKLESLLLSKLNIEAYKHDTDIYGPDPSLWPIPLRDERCRVDAWGTIKVYEAYDQEALGPQHITHQIAMTLHRMKSIGVYIGMKQFEVFKREVYQEEAKAKTLIVKVAKQHGLENFQPSKDNDVRKLVYGKMGLDVESKTKSGLASASVKDLKEHIDIPEIKALISYSKYDKLKTTYVDGLEKKFVRLNDGRYWLPVHINALAAKTGRRSSAGPNFQNLPVRVRQIIVSRFKGGGLADNDYSKLEPVIGGWVTGERRLTEYFTKYPNGYIKIGADFFNKTVEKNTKEYTMMKSLVLAILYKKQKWSLAADLWAQKCPLDSDYEKHTSECGKVLDRFLDKLFPGVRAYHERQEHFVLKHGYVDNALGQRRRLPLPPEPERSDRLAYRVWMKYKAHVVNQAVNYPIQSLASYVTGSAMIDLERELLHQYNWSYYDFQQAIMAKEWPQMPLLCCEVHDDIVQDIPKGMEAKTKEVTHAVMCAVPTLRKLLPKFDVELKVDTNHGPVWGLKS